MTNANEHEEVQTQEEAVEEETSYETEPDTGEVEETTEESSTEETGEETDEQVTISKSDYERLQRGLARKARIEGKGKKQSKPSSTESTDGYDQDLISRTYLAAQIGVTDADIQDQALEMAEKMNMKLPDAAKDSFFMDRIKHLQKQKQTQAGIAGNGGQNVAKERSVSQYVAEFKKSGNLPEDPKLVSKILDELAK